MPDQYKQPNSKDFNPVMASEELIAKIYERIDTFPVEHRTAIRIHVATSLMRPNKAIVPGPVSRPGYDLDEKTLTQTEKESVVS